MKFEEDDVIPLDPKEETDIPDEAPYTAEKMSENTRAYHLLVAKGGRKQVTVQFVSKPKNSPIPLNKDIPLSREDYELIRRERDLENDPDIDSLPPILQPRARAYHPGPQRT